MTSQILRLLKSLKYIGLILATIVATLYISRAFSKPPQSIKVPIRIMVHDTVEINRYIATVLHDTIRPTPTILQKIVEKVVPAETVRTYIPISGSNSSVFSDLFLVNKLRYKSDWLDVDAVNLGQKSYKHFAFKVTNPNFELGTNSEGVWVLQHRRFFTWNGVNIGTRYDGMLKPIIETGIMFMGKITLSGAITWNTYDVNLMWRVF